MKKNKVFLTGATGNMGYQVLSALAKELDDFELVLLVLDTWEDRKKLSPYKTQKGVRIVQGDMTNYATVKECVQDADLVIHMGALVSPAADHHPEKVMDVNYGSTMHILNAIYELNQQNATALVFIGTVAQTGDRQVPLHWGRVGDPIKPSVFDYYAVSKTAAEREVIESGLKRWVSLRQTGIMGPAMCKIRDGIILHNGSTNCLEYVSDRDSGTMIRNLCVYYRNGTLPEGFWTHIYNVGGGESCRMDSGSLYLELFKRLGLRHPGEVIPPYYLATQNFHGQFYLDSDKLESYLHFRNDSMEYFFSCYRKELGFGGTIIRFLCKNPVLDMLISKILRYEFRKMALLELGTLWSLKNRKKEYVEVFWGGFRLWKKLQKEKAYPLLDLELQEKRVVSHGYDESIPGEALTLKDIADAAEFRGGKCLSTNMKQGCMEEPLQFTCCFHHVFYASPKLILEGGHWCPECENQSWNYGTRAKKDPFFAQVWNPIHKRRPTREYPKQYHPLGYRLNKRIQNNL